MLYFILDSFSGFGILIRIYYGQNSLYTNSLYTPLKLLWGQIYSGLMSEPLGCDFTCRCIFANC